MHMRIGCDLSNSLWTPLASFRELVLSCILLHSFLLRLARELARLSKLTDMRPEPLLIGLFGPEGSTFNV